MELSISILELRSWVENRLAKAGINTIDQLVSSVLSGELSHVDGIGPDAFSEITSMAIRFLSGDLAKRKAEWEESFPTPPKRDIRQAALYRKILETIKSEDSEYNS